MADYLSQEKYWQRRSTAEALFQKAIENVPDLEKLQKQLKRSNKKIKKRSEEVRYRCVYEFRPDQNFDHDSEERGGYCDTWWRAGYFNLPIDEEGEWDDASAENAVPLPDNPITVYFTPQIQQYSVIREWTKCIHCKDLDNGVIFLFCKKHADLTTIEVIENFVNNGKEISDHLIKNMVDSHLSFLTELIQKSYVEAIEDSKNSLELEEKPEKVIEVRCSRFPEVGSEELITVYIDIIDCQEIKND